VNEKKIRRDIRIYKVLGPFCMIAGMGVMGAALYFQNLSKGSNNTLEYWKLQAFITGYFAFAAAIGFMIFSGVCLLLQRQAEYALYLKELLTTRNEHGIADVWR